MSVNKDVTTHGQLHPDDDGVTCYICLDTDLDSVPKCLQHPIKCTSNHVCQIIHGFGSDAHIPEIYCRAPHNCRRDIENHNIACKGGGFRIDDDVCEACCDSNECVSNVTNYLRLDLVSSQNLFCPGRCHTDTLQDCMHTGRVCDRLQFCLVGLLAGLCVCVCDRLQFCLVGLLAGLCVCVCDRLQFCLVGLLAGLCVCVCDRLQFCLVGLLAGLCVCVCDMLQFCLVGLLAGLCVCVCDTLQFCLVGLLAGLCVCVCDRLQFCLVGLLAGLCVCVCDRLQFCLVGLLAESFICYQCQNASAYNSDNYWRCTHDCCVTNECLFPHFGIHMASAVAPSTAPTTDTSGSAGSSLWQQLRGSCQDTFNLALCESLKNDHDLCRSRLSLSMCPETCGICAAVGSAVCQDTSAMCANIKMSDAAFCDTEEALFECPTTCGKCDQLLESVVLSVLGITTPAPSPAAPAAPGVTSPAVDCTSIKAEDCVHFGPLCQTTFLGVVCPDQCEFCANGEGTSA
ncbi:hypothetical protein RRG08_019085 [Elysia crispata]|uniref:ShKT domain-containing protein n=1 Tax=Elysia crispata TaxID=231223 RepID=A0AAE1A5B3_9GAST|nr:hypothetical protein RRG08_019085 [Elysia crispata]